MVRRWISYKFKFHSSCHVVHHLIHVFISFCFLGCSFNISSYSSLNMLLNFKLSSMIFRCEHFRIFLCIRVSVFHHFYVPVSSFDIVFLPLFIQQNLPVTSHSILTFSKRRPSIIYNYSSMETFEDQVLLIPPSSVSVKLFHVFFAHFLQLLLFMKKRSR